MSLPPNFFHSFPGMAPMMPLPGQYGPMGGLVPMIPGAQLLHQGNIGITVPTGVASVTAAPVRNMQMDMSPSLLGPYPGLLPPLLPQMPLLEIPAHLKKTSSGPAITVFVGSITDRASDMLIRQILSVSVRRLLFTFAHEPKQKCGIVNNWKRIQGANGKLQAFGFCDFGDPESAMRAMRILHDFEIADKSLVVKTDAKEKERLDDYVRSKKPGASADDPIDDQTKKEDEDIKSQIIALLREHEIELNRDPDPNKSSRRTARAADPKADNLDDVEMEEEKRCLINREIDKFRDTYKEEPEPEKTNDKPQDSRRDDRSLDSDRMRDRNRKGREQPRSRRERSPEDRGKVLEDEDTIERREQERRLREKEVSYQRRLQKWEDREMRKFREIDSRKRRETDRKTEETKEAVRLKMFLEDYDDDRDDAKYYRNKILSQRLKERKLEMEEDERDRRNEKRELEELRRKLIEEGHPDPEAEVKGLQKRDDEAKSLIDRLVSAARDGVQGDDSARGSASVTPMDEAAAAVISFPGMRMKHSEAVSPSVKEHKRHPDIFNSNEEDEASIKKRRKLPILLDDDDSMSSSKIESRFISSEEKRKQIKELIEEIPTSKDELFKYPIDWTLVDNSLMEKRIRPWINKKIAEYIGEEEPALLEFICGKLSTQATAESILNEVVMVLDEEAEVFVVKMWRLLIYEIRAKKAGLAK